MVDDIYSNIYGLATYVKESLASYSTVYKSAPNNLTVLVVAIEGILTANVYKPPLMQWLSVPLPVFLQPIVYCGDFNSHNEACGYEHNDQNGNALLEWILLNDLELVYSPKDVPTFKSARWGSETTSDLTIGSNKQMCNTFTRRGLQAFPRSQHRPVIFTFGLQVPLVHSKPVLRWNFIKADWRKFANELDNKDKHLPCDISAYNDFVRTVIDVAKHTVPRGFRQDYIPGWNKTCNDLYNSYSSTSDSEMANQLLDELNEQRRQKWHEMDRRQTHYRNHHLHRPLQLTISPVAWFA